MKTNLMLTAVALCCVHLVGSATDLGVLNATAINSPLFPPVIPEPSTYAMLAFGLLFVGLKYGKSKRITQGAAAVTDTAITTGVKAKLAADSELKTLDISVSTVAGHVRIQGTAPNEPSKVRAKQLASDVQGVVDVDNLLQIKSK